MTVVTAVIVVTVVITVTVVSKVTVVITTFNVLGCCFNRFP